MGGVQAGTFCLWELNDFGDDCLFQSFKLFSPELLDALVEEPDRAPKFSIKSIFNAIVSPESPMELPSFDLTRDLGPFIAHPVMKPNQLQIFLRIPLRLRDARIQVVVESESI